MNHEVSNNRFPHLPQEVQSLIAQNAPSTVDVETKSNKHGQRYKCNWCRPSAGDVFLLHIKQAARNFLTAR
ncbi:MAG: hypothetical protein IGR93_14525 [Hydrococcus sp. C42_A2020_068]|nr:hypothetical protein Ple7327_4607 [Pleurocapsa sp. PCC 7327]MBF2021278.1 hypothetical protein [Hydrococcus sp. C42_A2020_068]